MDKLVYSIESPRSLGALSHESPEERVQLEAAVAHWYKVCEEQKWPHAYNWFMNYAFLSGNHYPGFIYANNGISLDTAGSAHSNVNSGIKVPKCATPLLKRPFEVNVSLLTELKPYPRVNPKSSSPEDEDAAKLSEVVHELLWERPLRMPDRMSQMAQELCLCGTAALEIFYGETESPEQVPEFKTEETEDEIFGGTRKREVATGKTTTEMRKDIQSKVYNAFQLNVDPSATNDPDSMSWIMRTTFEDINWVKERFNRDEEGFYPENLDKVGPGIESGNTAMWYFSRIKDIIDNPQELRSFMSDRANQANNAPAPHMTTLTVVDVKPTVHFPEGRTIITAGGTLVYCGPARAWNARYAWRWHPYSISRFWTLPGRFWGAPLLSDLVPIQRRINAIDSLVQINREYMAIGQWLIPNTAKIPDGMMGGMPGQQIHYRTSPQGAKPEPVFGKPLPQELLMERALLVNTIDQISGTNKILEGENPSGVRSGLQLDFLKKETLKSKSNMLQGFERFLENVSQNILIEVSLNISEEDSELTSRIQASAREYSTMAIKGFTGMDLRDNIHVKIDLTNELMRSPEAKADRALQYMQYAGPNMTPLERAAVAKATGIEEFDQKISPHALKARRMISRISQGMLEAAQLVMPGIDDEGVFADAFRNELLSDRFIDYPKEVKATLFQTFQLYNTILQNKIQAAQAQQMEMQGGAPPAGPPEG